MVTPRLPAAATRHAPVDALRGFALLGIVLVNAPFFAQPPLAPPALDTPADAFAAWATLAFAAGKFFLIFSFLFGYGFSVRLARGGGGGAFLRRLGGLFAFGLLNAVFLFFGDILMLYAVLGVGLWLLRDARDRTLIALAAGLLALGVVTQTLVLAPADADAALAFGGVEPGAGYLGGVLDVTRQRLRDLPWALGFIALFNGPPAAAMFLLGLALGRRGAFPPSPARLARLRGPAVLAFAAGGPGSGVAAARLLVCTTPDCGAGASALLLSVTAPLLSFGMVVGMLTLAARSPEAAPIRLFATVGRNTLTDYLLHAALLGAIFYGWGLGLYGALGPAAVGAVAVLVYGAIAGLIAFWGRFFRQGPFEWALRSIAGTPHPVGR